MACRRNGPAGGVLQQQVRPQRVELPRGGRGGVGRGVRSSPGQLVELRCWAAEAEDLGHGGSRCRSDAGARRPERPLRAR